MTETRKPRILVVLESFSPDAAALYALDLVLLWAGKAEFRFGGGTPGGLEPAFTMIGATWHPGQDSGSDWRTFAPAWQPDLIYIASVGALHLAERFEMPPVPVLVQLLEQRYELSIISPGFAKRLLEWPDHYLAPSNAVAAYFSKELFVPSARTTVVRYALSGERVAELANRPKKEPGGPFVIGSAGTSEWPAGPVLWLYLVKEMLKIGSREDFRFVRWGNFSDSVDHTRFMWTINLLGLEGIVEIVGDSEDILPQVDVLAMTGWIDAPPVPILQSAALGIPVVSFAQNAGVAEFAGPSGISIEDYDTNAMAAAIVALRNDSGKPKKQPQGGDGKDLNRAASQAWSVVETLTRCG